MLWRYVYVVYTDNRTARPTNHVMDVTRMRYSTRLPIYEQLVAVHRLPILPGWSIMLTTDSIISNGPKDRSYMRNLGNKSDNSNKFLVLLSWSLILVLIITIITMGSLNGLIS